MCGYLSLAQIYLENKRKLKLKSNKDRIDFIKILKHDFLPEAPKRYEDQINGILRELELLGDKDLDTEPFWNSKSNLWLPTNYIEDQFLKNKIKIFLWCTDIDCLDFSPLGSNQFSCLQDSKFFRYTYWKDYYLSSSYKHILFSNQHYYLYEYDNNFLSIEFHSALDNLVVNFLKFILEI
jgi:hypothetical protein